MAMPGNRVLAKMGVDLHAISDDLQAIKAEIALRPTRWVILKLALGCMAAVVVAAAADRVSAAKTGLVRWRGRSRRLQALLIAAALRCLSVLYRGRNARSHIHVRRRDSVGGRIGSGNPLSRKLGVTELGAAPPVELVAGGCGWGGHRRHHWRDRWGYWR
jgi:hypothetical protein